MSARAIPIAAVLALLHATAAAEPAAPPNVRADAATEAAEPGGAPTTTTAAAPHDDADERGVKPRIQGYIQPQLSGRYLPEARPRDRWALGARPAVGVLVDGEPLEGWSYRAHVIVGGATVGGDVLALEQPFEPLRVAVEVEEAVVALRLTPSLALEAGHLRVPLTIEQQISSAALLFPNRSAPIDGFLGGSRAGTLARLHHRGVRLAAGGFYDRQELTGARERGILFAVRADVAPLGPMPLAQDDLERGPFRVGVGAGAAYLPTRRFEETGMASVPVRELRAAASARAAWRGLYAQAEVLRRQRTDGLTARPVIATGACAAVSQYVPVGPLGLAPMGRLGWTVEDQSFAPRDTVSIEAGLTLYPKPRAADPRALRLTVVYLGELRATEDEQAHGTLGQLHLRW